MIANVEQEDQSSMMNQTDVTRQAELVVMEYLKNSKCQQALDKFMMRATSSSLSMTGGEMYAADLESKKKNGGDKFASVLEYMVSTARSSMLLPTSSPSNSESSSRSRSERRRSSLEGEKGLSSAVWTKEDIVALKKGIKQTSHIEDKNERWKEIARVVGNGKSKKHCYLKYKELKEEKHTNGPSPSNSRSIKDKERRGSITPKEAHNNPSPVKHEKPKMEDFSAKHAAPVKQYSIEDTATAFVSTARSSTTSTSSVKTLLSDELQMEDCEDMDGILEQPARPTSGLVNIHMASGMSKPVSSVGRNPTSDEIAMVHQIIFGDEKKKMFSSHWEEQGFFFSDVSNLKYGLVQNEGGPCGVLAVVQGYVLRFLLANVSGDWRNPDDSQQKKALVTALTHILWQTARVGSSQCIIALNAGGLAVSNCSTKRKFMGGVMLHTTATEDQTRAHLMDHLHQFMAPKGNGLILFVISVLLSKGIAKIKSEMDHMEGMGSGGKLIGDHDYCTQELVNLLLCGQASSNVFDGDQLLEGINMDDPKATVLKGIPHQTSIGFLSLFEAYEYIVVGSYMKKPVFNIWVVCSESHYSVLFADPRHLQDARLDTRKQFDLFYFDGLANQDEEIQLSIDAFALDEKPKAKHDDLIPPLNLVIQTKWHLAVIDWNGVEPLL